MLIEVCANGLESALNAQKGGATRIELCQMAEVGGITPSAATLILTRKNLHLPIHVLLRPRAGDFLYTDLEFELMCEELEFIKQCGCHGIVCGILTAQGKVDVGRMKEWARRTRPLKLTFHRAFDLCSDPEEALEEVIACGADILLSSGGSAGAETGVALLKEMVEQAAGRIQIMAGSGIHPGNVLKVIRDSGVDAIHFSARQASGSAMLYKKEGLGMDEPRSVSSTQTIKQIKELILNHGL